MAKEKKRASKIKSRAVKVHHLLLIQKELLKKTKKFTSGKEPYLWLIRRSGHMQSFENATAGRFDFVHSDGNTRYIELTPSKLLHFDLPDRTAKVYVCHEDFPTPLTEDPVVTTEQIGISMEKTMADYNKFKLKEAQAISSGKIKVFLAIGGMVCLIALGITIVPSTFWEKIFHAGQPVVEQKIEENVTKPMLGMFMLIPQGVTRWKLWKKKKKKKC